MNFNEHYGKSLLAQAGMPVLASQLVTTPEQAAQAARELGPVVVKAQVPIGKRGKAGGIKLADTPQQAQDAATSILAMHIGPHAVHSVLVEQQAPIKTEFYAAVLTDAQSKGPVMMFSSAGGMDIEEIAATQPALLQRQVIDLDEGLSDAHAHALVASVESETVRASLVSVLKQLYAVWRAHDAELIEINPLAVLDDDRVIALDCKFVLDDSAIVRREELAAAGTPDPLTGLEERARDLGLKFIELDGTIGVLANGAGLTMTTMDVISHYGGGAANFLEIGGDAYTKATDALELVLDNPKVSSLVVNFCGAFARTDVMTEGVINAWQHLKPTVPAYFAIHGTGSVEARQMLADKLNLIAYPTMDDAIQAAINGDTPVTGAGA